MRQLFYSGWCILAMPVWLLAGIPTGFGQAQAIAFVHQQIPPDLSQDQGKGVMQLRDALKLLEGHYKVDIVFGDRIVQDFAVSAEKVLLKGTLEENLGRILQSTGLKFRKIGNNSYAILARGERKKQPELKNGDTPEAITPQKNTMIQAFPAEDFTTPAVEKKVSGRVTDEKEEPLPGVNILVKGTQRGMITDAEGKFSVEVDENAILVFSFVGYVSREVAVANRTTIEVAMQVDEKSLDEVVVVGYGTQLRGQMTGAVATVQGEQLTRRSVGKISQSLQGMVQGLRIIQSAGQPGKETIDMNIRGKSTFTNNPVLTVIDGVPADISTINPDDIASVSVLKDAAAASIYGTRASGGVILVTTKTGKAGTPKFSYIGTVGIQQPTRIPKKVSAYEHAVNYNEAELNDSPGRTSFTFSEADLARFSSPDWIDADMPGYLIRPSAMTQHNLGLSGGSENQRYFISMGYLKQNGIIRNTGYERINLRLNESINIGKKIRLDIRSALIPSKRTEPATVTYPGGPNSSLASALSEAFRYGNDVPLFTPDGKWASVRSGVNALALSSEEGGRLVSNDMQLTGNASLKYNIVENLNFTFLYGLDYTQNKSKDFRRKMSLYSPFSEGVVDMAVKNNALSISNLSSNFRSVQMLLDYDVNLKSGNLSMLGGFTQESYLEESHSVGRSDFLTENTQVINAGSTDRNLWTTSGTAADWALRSFIGRASYSHKDRYILEGSFRADGSSRFVPDLRWGFFPSLSAAWKISDEAFIKNIDAIDFFRLRSSWGKVGNQNVGFYPFAYTLTTRTYPFGGVPVRTVYTRSAANPELTWETKASVNVGIDLNLWKGLLEISADIYRERTSDILLVAPIPSTVGMGAPNQNVGIVLNRGWELQVSHRKNVGKLNYNLSFNISDSRNKVVDLKGLGPYIRDQESVTNSPGGQITSVGYPMDMWFGYESAGLFQTKEEVSNHAFQSVHTSPGDIKYTDVNNDNVINADDRVRLARSDIRYPFGFTLQLDYSNFEFSALTQGVLSHYEHVYGWLANNFDRPSSTIYSYHLDRWTPENPNARFPKHRVAQSVGINAQFSRYLLQNSAYLRLKNVYLGYNIPKHLTQKLSLDKVKLFLSGENVFTITRFLGLDPEIATTRNMTYPNAKVFSFGVDLRF